MVVKTFRSSSIWMKLHYFVTGIHEEKGHLGHCGKRPVHPIRKKFGNLFYRKFSVEHFLLNYFFETHFGTPKPICTIFLDGGVDFFLKSVFVHSTGTAQTFEYILEGPDGPDDVDRSLPCPDHLPPTEHGCSRVDHSGKAEAENEQ